MEKRHWPLLEDRGGFQRAGLRGNNSWQIKEWGKHLGKDKLERVKGGRVEENRASGGEGEAAEAVKLGPEGFRRHWQTLNLLREAERSRAKSPGRGKASPPEVGSVEPAELVPKSLSRASLGAERTEKERTDLDGPCKASFGSKP